MMRPTHTLLALLSTLTLLSASVAPAFAVCLSEEVGCPCAPEESAKPGVSEPCCCVVESPAEVPLRDAASTPLRTVLELAWAVPTGHALQSAVPVASPATEAWTPSPRPVSPLRVQHCSFLI